MSKWEKKFGRYAIQNLTVILILCYVAGYVVDWIMPAAAAFLSHGDGRLLVPHGTKQTVYDQIPL